MSSPSRWLNELPSKFTVWCAHVDLVHGVATLRSGRWLEVNNVVFMMANFLLSIFGMRESDTQISSTITLDPYLHRIQVTMKQIVGLPVVRDLYTRHNHGALKSTPKKVHAQRVHFGT